MHQPPMIAAQIALVEAQKVPGQEMDRRLPLRFLTCDLAGEALAHLGGAQDTSVPNRHQFAVERGGKIETGRQVRQVRRHVPAIRQKDMPTPVPIGAQAGRHLRSYAAKVPKRGVHVARQVQWIRAGP